MFADMSGYTSMSESFAALGAAGAEELGGLLNAHFEAAIAVVERFGGSVGKFGGDALSAIFPFDERPDAPGRAVGCALAIQTGMARFRSMETSVGTFDLRCKIGLAIGEVLAATVSAASGRSEWILAGSAIDRCGEAEQRSAPGGVMCDAALRLRCPGLILGPERDGFWVVRGLDRTPDLQPYPPLPPLSSQATDALARFVPPSVFERISLGHRGFVNEHRHIAVLFAGYGVLDTTTDAGVEELLERSAEALDAAERFEGYLHQIHAGDKGVLSIISFGAAVAHEDDEERALACAMSIATGPSKPSVGLALGTAFCGERGGPTRLEYAATGDTMNVAARLMQLAEPGTVLCTDTFGPRVRGRTVLKERPPVALKGRRRPVAIAELLEIREDPDPPVRSDLPLIGREDESAQIARAADAALEGRGSVVLIEGDAGTGKSRLTAESVSRASSSGFLVHATAAPPTDRSTPFLAWRSIVRSLIGIEDAGSGSVVDSLGSLDRNLIPRAPLLASILGSTMPETELTAGLDPQLRAELAMTLVGDLVHICAETSPRVLVIEDLQWLDPASRDLLIEVARRARAEHVMVITTYRSEGDEDPLAGWPLGSLPGLRIELGPLNDQAVRSFLAVAMERVFDRRGSSPPAVARTLIARAEGNAFYLEELLELCKDRGIDPTDEDAVASAELPAGLHRLALARLDTLPQTEQMVLRVASVVGRRFAEPWLAGSYPRLGAPAEVHGRLNGLGRRGLTRLVVNKPTREHEFKHAIVHEAAYTTLSDSSRQELHEAVARYVESRYVRDLRPHLGALAHHYGATRNIGKQREYFRRAADAARDAFANESAIRFYERLLPIVAGHEAVEASLLLGEVRQHAGDWEGAEEAFRSAQVAAERIDDERGGVRARSSLGYLLAHGDRVTAARGMLERAVADAERLDDPGATMSALEYLGFATWQLADYGASLATCIRLIDVASRAGDRRAESRALGGVGLARWRLGGYEDAREAFERAIDLAEQLDDARGLTHSANDLGGMLAETGDLVGAFTQVTRGLRLAREIGYRHAEAVLVGNAGELYRQHGELDAALRCSLQSLVVTAPMRDWSDIAFRLGNIALTLADMGRLDEADEFFAITMALARDIEDPYLISAFGHYRADAYARAGREADASALNLEALRLSREIDAHEIVVRATLLAVRLASASGSSAEAVDQQLEELERLDPVPTERAMLAYERWLVRPADPRRRRQATKAMEEIYRSMPGPENRRRLKTLGRSPAPTVDPLPSLDTGDLDTMSLDDAMLLARTLLEERASVSPEPTSSSQDG